MRAANAGRLRGWSVDCSRRLSVLLSPVEVQGVGLHSGQTTTARLLPACVNEGVYFLRTDLPGAAVIPARPSHVIATRLCTQLGAGAATVSTVEHLMAALAGMPGARAYPSQANMILVRVQDSAAVFQALKDRGILIKNVAGLHQLLANCIRLTVGLPSENDALIAALSELLREPLKPSQA